MIPDTNQGGNIAALSDVSETQKLLKGFKR